MRKFFPKRGWRRKKGPSSHPAQLAPHPGVVLIEHDDNLRHVVELWDGTEISQSSLPLCILGFLPNGRRGGPGPKDKGVSEWVGRQGDRRKLAVKRRVRRRVKELWDRKLIG